MAWEATGISRREQMNRPSQEKALLSLASSAVWFPRGLLASCEIEQLSARVQLGILMFQDRDTPWSAPVTETGLFQQCKFTQNKLGI